MFKFKFNENGTNRIAHKMSTDFIWWLVEEANVRNWDGEQLGEEFCQLDSDKKLKIATVVDEELRKQLAVLNKEKTCLSVPVLGSNILWSRTALWRCFWHLKKTAPTNEQTDQPTERPE